LIIMFVNSNDIKSMYYDNLSSLLIVSSSVLIFKGLVKNNLLFIALSGGLISLSMFTRVPSITMLIVLLAIIYYGFFIKSKFNLVAKQCFTFLAGFVLTTIFVICLMQYIGHLPIYIKTLKIGFGWAASSDDSHNIKQLTGNFIFSYSKSVIWGGILCILPFILNYFQNLIIKITSLEVKTIANLTKIAIIVFFLFLLITNRLTYNSLMTFFAGISLIATFVVLTSSRQTIELKLLVLLGCLFLLFSPLGSAGGLYAAGRSAFWIILPIALDFILRTKSINGSISITDDSNKDKVTDLFVTEGQLITMKNYFIMVCIIACLYFSYYYPYFDVSNRVKMFSAIENKLAKGILTTKERAFVINDLLLKSSKYVKKNDLVLAYDCIPMYHYLSETKPYLPNTWPWLYMPEQLKFELNYAQQKSQKLPVVILQKVYTLNSNWPQNDMIKLKRTPQELKRDSILEVFLIKNEYQKVWENGAFEIRLPVKQLITNSVMLLK